MDVRGFVALLVMCLFVAAVVRALVGAVVGGRRKGRRRESRRARPGNSRRQPARARVAPKDVISWRLGGSSRLDPLQTSCG